jgi:hypothetical protein
LFGEKRTTIYLNKAKIYAKSNAIEYLD